MNPETLRIIVADDEADMRDYFRKILPRLGHTVVAIAGNGRELVEQCKLHKPQLVITDIKMPEMDGIEAAATICREFPTPFILLSAYHDAELVRRAQENHVMSYLAKPIKQADLAAAISSAVRRFEEVQSSEGDSAHDGTNPHTS